MSHYVYLHVHHDTGYPVVFYVGKGYGKRAWSTNSRNKMWHNVSSKHGWSVVIHKDNLTEKEAYDIERELIDKIGRRDIGTGPLVNMAVGGKFGALGPNGLEKMKEGQRKSWANKREMRVESLRASWTDERKRNQNFANTRKGSSDSAKRQWSDPLKRAEMIEKMRAGHAARRASGRPRYTTPRNNNSN